MELPQVRVRAGGSGSRERGAAMQVSLQLRRGGPRGGCLQEVVTPALPRGCPGQEYPRD